LRKDTMCSRRFAATLCLACLFAAACGGVVEPSKNNVETFSGTLAVGAANGHDFTVARSGEFEVTITALAPVSTVFIGTGFGQARSDGTCGVFPGYVNNFSSLNRSSLGGAITPGNYCVVVFDVGTIPEPLTLTYTVKVSHP